MSTVASRADDHGIQGCILESNIEAWGKGQSDRVLLLNAGCTMHEGSVNTLNSS